jgi:hypothetical protein
MTVYRNGRVQALDEAPAKAVAAFRGWRALFPMKAIQDLLRAAYARTDRLNTPPRGEPFFEKGEPYATEAEFIEDLLHEFKAQLERYLSGHDKGVLVSESKGRQARPAVPDPGRALALALVKGGAAKKAE